MSSSAGGFGTRLRSHRASTVFRVAVLALALAGLVTQGPLASKIPTKSGVLGATANPSAWLDYGSLKLMNYAIGSTSPNPLNQNPVNITRLNSDLARIAALNANAVRLSIPYTLVPDANQINRLQTFVAIAAKHGLRVQLTLFGQYTAYDPTWSQQWAQSVVTPFAGDTRIAFIEIQNEMDPNNAAAMSWAQTMIPFIRGVAQGIPVTVSEGGWCSIINNLRGLKNKLSATPPDFWSVHFYCDPAAAATTFKAAAKIASPLPVVIGEAGWTTDVADVNTPGAVYGTAWQEAEQAVFYQAVDAAASDAGLAPAAPWTDSDYAPAYCAGCRSRELHFGLYRTDGSAKPAAAVVAAAFTAVPQVDTNFGLEEDAGGFPVVWQTAAPKSATFTHDATVAHTGTRSVEISGATYSGTGAAPAWYLNVPGTPTQYKTYALTAWVRGLNVNGYVYIAINWQNAYGYSIGYAPSANLPMGDDSTWHQLTVYAKPPAGAAWAQIVMTSQSSGAAWFDDVTFG